MVSVNRLSPGDPGSFSHPDEAIITHMHLELEVNFDKKILSGHADLTINVLKEGTDNLVLDTRELHIKKIVCELDGKELKYELGDQIATFGRKLTVNFPPSYPKRFVLKVFYETDENASALQWLDPNQTYGKKHPYVFSQCQPDHCRSIVPCQDSPAVKGTYSATITAPGNLTALMSALREGDESTPDGKKKFNFRQNVPIPSYLMAIAVGNLKGVRLGPRSEVWSEPEIVDKAASEFSGADEMLKTAEEICGPYVWGIYDLLLLPPSFPYGGMENPCLTFLTPTLLANDKSMISVVAHEIAHSWTGNLVSIKNFEHFWLNEGFTVFIERKINGRLKGESYRQFCAIGGLKELRDSIMTQGPENPLTKLVVDLTGIDPDDAFSVCPYEKGHTFLFYLEQLLGGPDKFEPFLRSYFEEFKYKSVETDDFKNYLIKYFAKDVNLEIINWDLWLFSPGMPPVIPSYDTRLQDACAKLADEWCNWKEDNSYEGLFSGKDLAAFQPEQIREFAAILLEKAPLSIKKLRLMNDLYKMGSYNNAEIKYRWIRICLKAHWKEKVEPALEFATEQGRMKYVRPIFRDLLSWSETREIAIQRIEKFKPSMMQVLYRGLTNDIKTTIPR